MADEMIRMAGRGSDGTAKALSTTNSGELNSVLSNGIGKKTIKNVHESTVIPDGVVQTFIANSESRVFEGRYNEIELSARFDEVVKGTITITHYFVDETYGYKAVHTDTIGVNSMFINEKIETKGNAWRITFRNNSGADVTLLGFYISGSFQLSNRIKTDQSGRLETVVKDGSGKTTLINHHTPILIDTNPLGVNITSGFDLADVDGRYNELEITLRMATRTKGRIVVNQYFSFGNTGHKLVGSDELAFDDIYTTARVKTKGNRWSITVINDTNATKELLGFYVAGSYDSTNVSTIANVEDISRIGYDASSGDAVTDYSFEKDIDGYNALRVIDSAPWGYDNEINATQVFVSGNKTMSQEVMQRTTVNQAGLNTNEIKVPKGAKGVVFQTEIINVTGDFAENEGIRPALHFLTSEWVVNPTSIMNTSSENKSDSGLITIICHPDVDPELTNMSTYPLHPVKVVKTNVFDVMRFRFTASGSFDAGQSIEYHARALWLF